MRSCPILPGRVDPGGVYDVVPEGDDENVSAQQDLVLNSHPHLGPASQSRELQHIWAHRPPARTPEKERQMIKRSSFSAGHYSDNVFVIAIPA